MEATKFKEIDAPNLTDLQMQDYMEFNLHSMLQIRCKSNIPLTYIHTRHCYSNKTHAKDWKIICAKCEQKLRNTYVWHCRCEKGKCKKQFNFCHSCFVLHIDKRQRNKSMIKTWSNNDIHKWIETTKWLGIPKKEIQNFKQYLKKNIFNNILNGFELISLSQATILNLSKKLPFHWQTGFKNAFILPETDKLYTQSITYECKLETMKRKLTVLAFGYFKKIDVGLLRYIGNDVIELVAKYVIFGVVTEKYDLKLLEEEKVYIFDDIMLKPYSKLLIGQKVKGIKVLNHIQMEKGSMITSSIHYEQPANINIMCSGNIIMNGGIIEIQTTNGIKPRNIDITCHDLIMDKSANMRTVAYVLNKMWHEDGCDFYKGILYGKISIALRTNSYNNWLPKQFEPYPIINGMENDNTRIRGVTLDVRTAFGYGMS
eukprot:180560_1